MVRISPTFVKLTDTHVQILWREITPNIPKCYIERNEYKFNSKIIEVSYLLFPGKRT